MKRLVTVLGVFLGVGLLATVPALATTLSVSSGGLTAPNANYGCPTGSANCLTSLDFQLAAAAAATGTITTNAAGTQATLSLDVASVSFAPTSGMGSNEVFSNVHYSGTVSVFSTASIISQLSPGTGTVTGDINGSPFSAPSAIYNLTCALSGSSGQCGVAFGPQGFTADSHDWLHTFAVVVNVVPEPATAALVLLGFAGLGLRRRR